MNDERKPGQSRSEASRQPHPAAAADHATFRRDLLKKVMEHFARHELAEAAEALRAPVPHWEGPDEPRRGELATIIGLGIFLATFNRSQEALELMESIEPFVQSESKGLELLGNLQVKAGRAEEGKANLLRARQLGPARASLMMALAEAADATGDIALAREQTRHYINTAPLYITPSFPGQVTLLAVPRRTGRIRRFDSPDRVHFPGGFVSQLFHRQPDVYRFVSIFVDSENALKAVAKAPKPDLVYNAYAHPERPMLGEGAQRLASLAGVLGAPMINPPERVRSAAAESPAKRYAGIAGVVVPQSRRYERGDDLPALLRRIEDEVGFPMVVRPAARRAPPGSVLVAGPDELEAAIAALQAPDFVASSFHESRHRDNLSRKIRAAVIGDAIHVVRVDYDPGWSVGSRENVERARFYVDNPALIEEERRICADPEAAFGKEAMGKLAAMRARIPLDVFGMDFDVTEAGEILFFEAGAAMNLLSTGIDPAIDHPQEADQRVLEAFRAFTDRLKAASASR